MVYIIYRFTWLSAQPASNEVLILMVNKLTPDTGPKGALVSLFTPRVAPVFLILLRYQVKGSCPRYLNITPEPRNARVSLNFLYVPRIGLGSFCFLFVQRVALNSNFFLNFTWRAQVSLILLLENKESSGSSNLTPGNQGELRSL